MYNNYYLLAKIPEKEINYDQKWISLYMFMIIYMFMTNIRKFKGNLGKQGK